MRAIGSHVDGMDIGTKGAGGAEGWWSVREGHALLDKGAMRKGAVHDEDGRAAADIDGHNRAIGSLEVAEDVAELGEGLDEPQIAQYGNGWRIGWYFPLTPRP